MKLKTQIRILILQIVLGNPGLIKNCFFKMLISCQVRDFLTFAVVSENETRGDDGKFSG